jgi:dienelactone hydrolase
MLAGALAVMLLVPLPGLCQAVAERTLREATVVLAAGNGRVLAGTLTMPREGGGPFPVALTITGSGAHLRDGNRTPRDQYRPFRQIARTLAAHGVATLRLDDRGVGQSTGNAATADGDDVADDTRVAVAWLRRHAGIDGARIALIGHSFGGVIAPIVAANDPGIAAVVLMGAPARSFRETMRYQLGYTIANDADIPASGRTAALDAAMEQQARNVAASAERWRPWLQHYDPLPVAARVRSPVLILHGRTDRAVSPKDAEDLSAAIRGGGNIRVAVRFFDNTNHHFQHDSVGAREGYARLPTQDLSPEVLEVLSEWLLKTLGRGSVPDV